MTIETIAFLVCGFMMMFVIVMLEVQRSCAEILSKRNYFRLKNGNLFSYVRRIMKNVP